MKLIDNITVEHQALITRRDFCQKGLFIQLKTVREPIQDDKFPLSHIPRLVKFLPFYDLKPQKGTLLV